MPVIRNLTILPKSDSNLIIFIILVRLRPNESLKAIPLLHHNLDTYWNQSKGIIEHYKFPTKFIRRTKIVYIGVVTPAIEEIAQRCSKGTYNSLKFVLTRKNIEMNINYSSKDFVTYLRSNGIEPEIIGLLQGRINSSVFVNYYYRPDINETITKRIRPAFEELSEEWIG